MIKINLLIPDPQTPSSYCIIRGLRFLSNRIVAVVPKINNFFNVVSLSANSKYTDKIYYATNPSTDWLSGVYHENNTFMEEIYINEIINICKKENITVIYPSWDPFVYVYSKNLARFKEMGIDIPILEYSKLITITDKYKITSMASNFGIDCPKTFLIDKNFFSKDIISQLNFPIIVKPRFGTSAKDVYKIENKTDFLRSSNKFLNGHKELIVQEFIPGGQIINVNVVMDKNSECDTRFITCWKSENSEMIVFQNMALAMKLTPFPKNINIVVDFLKKIQCKGLAIVQFKMDSTTKELKFLEINSRLSGYSWAPMELGFNRPLMIYSIFKGESQEFIKGKQFDKLKEAIFLSPIDDFFIFIVYIWCLLQKTFYKILLPYMENPFKNLMVFKKVIKYYMNNYLYSKKCFHIIAKSLIRDPMVFFCYCFLCLIRLLKQEYPHNFQQ